MTAEIALNIIEQLCLSSKERKKLAKLLLAQKEKSNGKKYQWMKDHFKALLFRLANKSS